MITREELERQLSVKSGKWWDAIQTNVGRENLYSCMASGHRIVTVDRHAGVTPMSMACRTEGCMGVMLSAGYPPIESKPAELGEPTHEWYRPDEVDDEVEDDHEADHVMNGGLLIREIPSGE